jgi:hypothetical protein
MHGTSHAESSPWWWDTASQWNRADGNELSWALASWLNLIYPDPICYLLLDQVVAAATMIVVAVCAQVVATARD